MKHSTFASLVIIAVLFVGFVWGEQYGRQAKTDTVMAQSEIEYQWEYIEVPVPVVREVIKEIHHTEVIYSDVPGLRFFEDKAELKEWVQANLVEDMGSQRCVAEALEMQRRAIADGYQVSVQAMFTGLSEPVEKEWELVVSAFTKDGSMYYVWPVSGMVRYTGHSIREIR